MIGVVNYYIANITFRVTFEKTVKLLDSEPAYQPFLWKAGSQSTQKTVDCQLHIQTGKIPDIEKKNELFDSGQSWSMFEADNDYVISLHPPGFKQPIWLARINRNLADGTIYCRKSEIGGIEGDDFIPNPFQYPLDQILLMYILAHNEGAIVHSAGISLREKGYIFPGQSGAGKSTLSKQFLSSGCTNLLSDDRIVVRRHDDTFKAYGTPWPGEAGIAENNSAPLAGIFFINHGPENRIKKIKPQKALERLFPVTSIPWYDRGVMPKILDFCEDLIFNVPTYELDFKPSVEVVDVLDMFL